MLLFKEKTDNVSKTNESMKLVSNTLCTVIHAL